MAGTGGSGTGPTGPGGPGPGRSIPRHLLDAAGFVLAVAAIAVLAAAETLSKAGKLTNH